MIDESPWSNPEDMSGSKRGVGMKVGFAVLYRWRLRPEMEDAFIDAWRTVSELLESERGSCGARLHKGADGLWYSYAQWPNEQARAHAFSQGDVDPEAQAVMAAAILERLPEISLEPVVDLLKC